jgi:hypothetical protein
VSAAGLAAGFAGRPIARSAQPPAQRWTDAVAARPLETPRPFPGGLQPLLHRTSAGGPRPRYTTGPATRAALDAAGAHGATTGSVVHLPAPPPARLPGAPGKLLGVIAHELAHARQPVGRPRFLLRTADGAADAEEREAQQVSAGIVGALPMARTGGGGTTTTATGGGTGAGRPDAAAPPGGDPFQAVWRTLEDAEPTGTGETAETSGPQRADEPAATAAPATVQQPPAAAAPPGVDLDRIAEALEERLIRQLERRGGRYVGMF